MRRFGGTFYTHSICERERGEKKGSESATRKREICRRRTHLFLLSRTGNPNSRISCKFADKREILWGGPRFSTFSPSFLPFFWPLPSFLWRATVSRNGYVSITLHKGIRNFLFFFFLLPNSCANVNKGDGANVIYFSFEFQPEMWRSTTPWKRNALSKRIILQWKCVLLLLRIK